MVELAARGGRPLVLAHAAAAAAAEISELAGVAHGRRHRAEAGARALGIDAAPERAQARSEGDDRRRAPRRRTAPPSRRAASVCRSRRPARANSTAGSSKATKPTMKAAMLAAAASVTARPLRANTPAKRARPGVDRVGFVAQLGQRARHVDVELVRRRILAVRQAGAALVAEIGEVVQVAAAEGAPHLHRREHRAQALAIAAGVADGHQPVGFVQGFSCWHASPLPLRRCGRTPCRWSCRCRRDSPCPARCRP